VPKCRFIDDLKERSNAEELLEEIMDQKVSIRLKDILTSSDTLTKLMFKGMPSKKHKGEEVVVKVGKLSM
jgi:hypothetical protein